MFGSDLRSYLEEFGLSQADLARLVSVTPRAVSLWMKGDREVPGAVEAYVRLLATLPMADEPGGHGARELLGRLVSLPASTPRGANCPCFARTYGC